tara:strand:+ start:4922 stop:5461 length:540 start_codon:yes stop_codon:yes gene_type:complete
MTKVQSTPVFWITGLSGSGKSTFAEILLQEIRKQTKVIGVDGDKMREVIDDPSYKYTRESRLNGAYQYCKFAKLIAEQNVPVVVSTISLFHEIHQWNKENLSCYIEIYIKCDMKTLIARDPKGLYKKENQANMPGLGQVYEAPIKPDYYLFEPSIDSLKELAQELVTTHFKLKENYYEK